MKIRNFAVGLGLALTALCLAAPASAGSVGLSPSTASAAPGDTISFDIVANFDDDPTLGGGIDVFFDPTALAFSSYTFADIGDADFARPPDVFAGHLYGITFGEFDNCPGPNCATGGGDFLVGTLSFDVLATAGIGVTSLMLDASANPVGGFVSGVNFDAQTVAFGGADITVVPLPAPLLLLGSALAALTGLRRRAAA